MVPLRRPRAALIKHSSGPLALAVCDSRRSIRLDVASRALAEAELGISVGKAAMAQVAAVLAYDVEFDLEFILAVEHFGGFDMDLLAGAQEGDWEMAGWVLRRAKQRTRIEAVFVDLIAQLAWQCEEPACSHRYGGRLLLACSRLVKCALHLWVCFKSVAGYDFVVAAGHLMTGCELGRRRRDSERLEGAEKVLLSKSPLVVWFRLLNGLFVVFGTVEAIVGEWPL